MSAKKYSLPRGTRDFLPGETAVRGHVRGKVESVFKSFGYMRIQTPTFEEFALLSARAGEKIRESMFTFFCDGAEYALRPEMTAPVCRLIASGMFAGMPKPHKLYYIERCFRYERPREGAYREFTQAGVELIGSASPAADAEVIALAVRALESLGISSYKLKIGSIGIYRELLNQEGLSSKKQDKVVELIDSMASVREKCAAILASAGSHEDDIDYVRRELTEIYDAQQSTGYEGDFAVTLPEKYDAAVAAEWLKKLPAYAEDTCRHRLAAEGLVKAEMATLLLALSGVQGGFAEVEPKAAELLKSYQAAMGEFDRLGEVCACLASGGVKNFEIVLGIAAGFDFYTGAVFEINAEVSGGRKRICGGGRYDKLVEDFGGEHTPAAGFAFGFDRLVEAFEVSGGKADKSAIDVCIAAESNDAAVIGTAIGIAGELRGAGFRTAAPLSDEGIDAQLAYAAATGARAVVVVGPADVEKKQCRLRAADGSERVVPADGLSKILSNESAMS